MANAKRSRNLPRAKNVTHASPHHGHPFAWMTMLFASLAAIIILFMCIAALQIAQYIS